MVCMSILEGYQMNIYSEFFVVVVLKNGPVVLDWNVQAFTDIYRCLVRPQETERSFADFFWRNQLSKLHSALFAICYIAKWPIPELQTGKSVTI